MSEEARTIATLNACAGGMKLMGKQRDEMLANIAASLNVMLGSAVALVDGLGNVVGYQIKTGALHRVLGYMAGLDHPVTVPLCRTRLVLNHESSPWPLEGEPNPATDAGVPGPAKDELPPKCAGCERRCSGCPMSHPDSTRGVPGPFHQRLPNPHRRSNT
jgi:hypothetical protein